MRVQTFLPQKEQVKFNSKMKEQNTTSYKLAQNLIVNGLINLPKTPLSEYSTSELLQEIWRRIP